jgi:hypothetical protein
MGGLYLPQQAWIASKNCDLTWINQSKKQKERIR